MKQAVIFDYGGVLMKTLDYHPRHSWDDQLRLERGSVERAVHGTQSWLDVMTGQITLVDYWADVARQLALDEAQIRQLGHDFYSGDQLDLNLIAYIRQLRERGHTVALLSNASPALRGELGQLGITSLFEPLVVSCEIGVLKPDARAYQAVLERCGRQPDEAIFVDDMPANIAGAQAVGLHGVLYTAGMDLEAALEPLLEL